MGEALVQTLEKLKAFKISKKVFVRDLNKQIKFWNLALKSSYKRMGNSCKSYLKESNRVYEELKKDNDIFPFSEIPACFKLSNISNDPHFELAIKKSIDAKVVGEIIGSISTNRSANVVKRSFRIPSNEYEVIFLDDRRFDSEHFYRMQKVITLTKETPSTLLNLTISRKRQVSRSNLAKRFKTAIMGVPKAIK